MKARRVINGILAGVMILSLVACGTSEEEKEAVNTPSDTEQTEESVAEYVFSDNYLAFVSDSEVKFVEQQDYAKIYDKSELEDGGTVIEIDPSKTYQTIEGFGASLTDASAYLLLQMPKEELSKAMTRLFDNEEGIGLNIIRNPIGACDFSLYYYTYDDMPAGQEDWNLEHFDASEAQKQVDLVKKAMAVNPDIKLMLSPWTAPPWMKTKGDYTGVDGGSLRRECYDVYADYLVKSVQIYENENIPVYAITPQNEMFLAAKWAGMTWDWENISAFINDDLRPALTEAGLSTKILNMDHNWSYWQEANRMMSATYNTADGVAYHWYNGEPEDMLNTYNYFPDKLIYVTEATNIKPSSSVTFFKVISAITRSLRSGANGYMMWNYALRPEGGPYLYETAANNIGILTCDVEAGEITYEGDFYALAHFSKYMDVGAVRVDSTDTGADTSNKLLNVVVLNPDGTMTAVIANSDKEDAVCKLVMGDQVMEVTVGGRDTVTLTWDANKY